MQWPARISGGRIYRQPVISLDIVPTVLAAAGLPADVPGLDGGNLLPFVEGATTGTPHAVLLRLNINMEYPGAEGLVRWQPVKLTDSGSIDFTELYGSRDKAVAYAVAVLRVAKPTTVAITTNAYSAVAYLDGEWLGVSGDKYGRNRQVSRTLAAGDHIVLCAVAQRGTAWQLSVRVAVDPKAAPGDVRVLPVEQFGEVPAVAPPAQAAMPQGKGLPFADGYNCKLVYDDDFNRDRIGQDWIQWEPQAWYEGKSWYLEDGHLVTRGSSYWQYLSYAQPVTPPVRVECDFTGAPERTKEPFQAVTLTPRNQVGGRTLWNMDGIKGAGYMLAAGWNRNPNSVSLWRLNGEIQVNLKSPTLEAGRTRHIIAQFSPKRVLLVVDGEVSLDYKDPEFRPGLDTVSLMNGFGRDWIDNLRIYQAAPQC